MIKNTKLFYIMTLFLMLALVFQVSCSLEAKPQGTPAATDQQAKGMLENTLTAINDGNYTSFTADFSDQMKKTFTETRFTQVRDLVTNASGKFISAGDGELKAAGSPGSVAYVFTCKYEKEDVKVTLVYKIGGDKIEGLFFDSPNIRKASK